MLSHYLNEVANREFAERDRELPRMITRIIQEMSSRGVVHSSMTLDAIADLFVDEFLVRCDFLREFVIAHPGLLMTEGVEDLMTAAKVAYQERSSQEREKIASLYDSSTLTVSKALQNESMKGQIKKRLHRSMSDRIDTNNLYVEVAYREISISKAGDGVLILKPSVYGIGIDLKELYRRHLEPMLRWKQRRET